MLRVMPVDKRMYKQCGGISVTERLQMDLCWLRVGVQLTASIVVYVRREWKCARQYSRVVNSNGITRHENMLAATGW